MYNYLETKMTWRIIARYPNYEIDTWGNVINIHTQKEMKSYNRNTYNHGLYMKLAAVYLRNNNGPPKMEFIQNLMDETFTEKEIMGDLYYGSDEEDDDNNHRNIFGDNNYSDYENDDDEDEDDE